MHGADIKDIRYFSSYEGKIHTNCIAIKSAIHSCVCVCVYVCMYVYVCVVVAIKISQHACLPLPITIYHYHSISTSQSTYTMMYTNKQKHARDLATKTENLLGGNAY
jgi:hypothetical protein